MDERVVSIPESFDLIVVLAMSGIVSVLISVILLAVIFWKKEYYQPKRIKRNFL